jgi:TPR repeat protein
LERIIIAPGFYEQTMSTMGVATIVDEIRAAWDGGGIEAAAKTADRLQKMFGWTKVASAIELFELSIINDAYEQGRISEKQMIAAMEFAEGLLERRAQADSERLKGNETRIKNRDLLERWAQGDKGRIQPEAVGIVQRRLSDETEQTRKRPRTRLVMALVSAIVCIGGVATLGSLNRPMEGSTGSSEISRSVPNLQSLGKVAVGERTSSEAPLEDATAGTLARSNRFQPGRSQQSHTISSADEAKLLARAESLIKQFDFAAARLLLAYALEKGSARAALMMAETYDPQILRSLQTNGIRGDRQRAREFYQLAAEAGLEKARERVEALRADANFDARMGGENRSR